MIRMVVGLAIVACGILSAVADETGFANSDFNDGKGIWRLPGDCWGIENGKGRDGSKCLSLTIKDWQKVRWPSTERFPIEPGGAYRLEAWVDASQFRLPKGFVHVGISFYDEEGKSVLGCIALPSADNDVRRDGWRRHVCVTRTVPETARTAGFYIWAPDGSTGVALFDDIKIQPVAAKQLDALCVSAYRAEAVSGDVGFAAGFSVNPFKYDKKSLKADLRYVSITGTRTVPVALSDSVAKVMVPVRTFAMGTNTVTLTLRDRSGAKIDESSCKFARLPSHPRRKVTFDGHNRTIVDGSLFFPLGMYCLDINAADIAIYTNAPFNCIMPYRRTDAAKLDICEAAGIKVIYPVHGSYDELDKASPEQRKKLNEEKICSKVRRYKDHPAVLAWYTADEIREPHSYLLTERNDAIHALDPDHPTWIVIYDTGHVRSFVQGYDVIGMDPYPIGGRGFGRKKIGISAGWPLEAQKRMYGFRPMWHVPQAFDWGFYRPAETNSPSVRLPTLPEMRSMAWQAVSAGASGLVFYSFHDLLKRDKWPKERVAGGWESVCAVAREVKAKESVLLSDPGPTVECDSGDVVCRTWRTCTGEVHLLACNMTDAAVKTRIVISGHAFNVTLPPIGVKWLTTGSRK